MLGACYAYIGQSFGKIVGAGSAVLAAGSYAVITAAEIVVVGYFAKCSCEQSLGRIESASSVGVLGSRQSPSFRTKEALPILVLRHARSVAPSGGSVKPSQNELTMPKNLRGRPSARCRLDSHTRRGICSLIKCHLTGDDAGYI